MNNFYLFLKNLLNFNNMTYNLLYNKNENEDNISYE